MQSANLQRLQVHGEQRRVSPTERSGSHIFISPHFDDGILSCGGTLNQLAAGHAVTVMTMMGGLFAGALPDTPILADLHQRWQAGSNPLLTRRLEDMRALRSIGASHLHIPVADCVYRVVDDMALYPTEESLFGDVHPKDDAPAFLSQVSIPCADAPVTVYIPLAVGHHVDHQIVRDWGLLLLSNKPEQVSIRFYAEYPYLNADKAIDAALTELGISLVADNAILSEQDIRAKVKAIACYKSQISTFWESPEAMEADVRQSSTHPQSGAYVERFWDVT